MIKNKRRLLAIALALLPMTSILAQTVAKIGSTEYATIAEAVTASTAGQTIDVVAAGTYTLPGIPQNITINGSVDGVVFSHTTGGNIASIPNGVTFKNVSFTFGNNDYHGFHAAGTINMEGCTLNGKLFSYGNMNFTNCKFVQNDGDYNMWNYYGANNYYDCTFTNTVKGKFLNVYREDAKAGLSVLVKDCKFINNGTLSKAALNVKSNGTLNYNVVVEGCEVEGSFPTAASYASNGEGKYIIIYGPLVQVDDIVDGTYDKNTITIDDDVVYKTGHNVETIEIGTVEQLKAFRDAVNAGNQYTYNKMLLTADLDLSGEAWLPIGNLKAYPGQSFDGTFDGNGHSISNLTTTGDGVANNCVAGLFGSVVNGTIKNLTVKNVNISSTHYAAGIVAYTSNKPVIRNCHVIGGTISSLPEWLGSGFDNGDKIGGIMGYATAGSVIDQCTVKDINLRAYRDFGGIVGFSAGSVTNCNASNIELVQDNTNAYKDETITTYAAIIGRDSATEKENNTSDAVTTKSENVAAVAQVGDAYYSSLQFAINAANAKTGDVTIKMLRDVNEEVTVAQKAGVNMTIDGDNNKLVGRIVVDGDIRHSGTETLTLKNIAFRDGNKSSIIYLSKQCHNVVITDCTYDTDSFEAGRWFVNYGGSNQNVYIAEMRNLNISNCRVAQLVFDNNGHPGQTSLIVDNVTATEGVPVGFNIKGTGDAIIQNSNITVSKYVVRDMTDAYTGIITLKNNNFFASSSDESDEGVIVNRGGLVGTAHINVESGTYQGDVKVLNGKTKVLAISGGYFSNPVLEEYCAEEYYPVDGYSDPTPYGVMHYVADVNGTYYKTFAEALEAVTDGAVLKLLEDITLDADQTLNDADFTLTFGSFSVTKNSFGLTIPAGHKVITDKQTDIFVADAADILFEEEDGGVYTYSTATAIAKVGDVKYTSLRAALDAATAASNNAVVDLLADATLDITAWSGTKNPLSIGTAETETITINGNGHTLTFNQKDSDWNNVATMNDEQTKLVLNDMNIANSGYNNGPWNRYDINFNCAVELNNVTSEKALAFKNAATLNNVTVNDSGDVYGIWIQTNGQEVEMDNVTVNVPNGRGIAIKDQYVDADEGVTKLAVDNSTFVTAKKAAILATAQYGAEITASGNDISQVAADSKNLVWVDEDLATQYEDVTLISDDATMIPEGDIEEYDAALQNGTTVHGYYKKVTEAIVAAADGQEVELQRACTLSADAAVQADATILLTLGEYSLGNGGKHILLGETSKVSVDQAAGLLFDAAVAGGVVSQGVDNERYVYSCFVPEIGEVNVQSTAVTIGESGYATFTSSEDVDFSSWTTITAYVAANYENGTLDLWRVENAHAGEGILLKGEVGSTETVVKYEGGETLSDTYNNLLVGVLYDMPINGTDGLYTNLALGYANGAWGFYKSIDNGTIHAGKAYLRLLTSELGSAPSRGITMRFFNETNGIAEMTTVRSLDNSMVYDLQGRRVKTPVKGMLYIIGGKKMVY